MRDDIVLMGPLSAGKTTLALYLSVRLQRPSFPMDRLKWYYLYRNGYDLASASAILQLGGFAALLAYAKSYFSLSDLERFLDDFRGGVIDFGANHSVFDDLTSLQEAQRILQPFANVVLLLPTPDLEGNIAILTERIRQRYSGREHTPRVVESYVEANEHFLKNRSNELLARHIVYTHGKTVDETGEEVIALCGQARVGPRTGCSDRNLG